jgi:hypothetical protein
MKIAPVTRHMAAAAITAAVMIAAASETTATEPNGGYYEGLAIFYPYDPVFCDKNSGLGGPCFGMPGSGTFLPKSAPLPPGHKHCEWADIKDPKSKVNLGNGLVGMTGEGWYQWEPRTITLYKKDASVCYLEDRGSPRNINDLPRDDE